MPADARPDNSAEPDIAALLLAAGLSTRMGAANKLLIETGGETIVRRAARTLLDCGLKVYAVTGHERDKIEAALAGLDVEICFNPDYRRGRRASVRAGLACTGDRHGAVMVALGDQPFLERSDIETLLSAYRETERDAFLVPYFEGRRGHPVIIPRTFVRDIVNAPRGNSEAPLTDLFPDKVRRFEAANDHFVRDIDTPEDREWLHGLIS